MSGGFHQFCGSPLWEDFPEVANTTDGPNTTAAPQRLVFTECFQSTVLVWVPCAYLAIVAPIYFWHLVKQTNNVIRLNWINVTKLVLGGALLLLCAATIFHRVHIHHRGDTLYTAVLLAPAVNFITMALATILIEFGRRKGERVSGLLFTFWLMQTIAGALTLHSVVEIYMIRGTGVYNIVATSIFLLLVFVQWIFSCLVDRIPYSESLKCHPYELPPSPEHSVSFLSVLSFWWFTSLVILGYKKSLEHKDLWSLNPEDLSVNIAPKLEHEWKKEVEKMKRSKEKLLHQTPDVDIPLKSADDKAEPEVTVRRGKKPYVPSLVLALARAHGATFLFGACLKLIHDILLFISPLLLKLLIEFTKDRTQPDWMGYSYAFLLLAVAIVQSMVLHQYFHRCFLTGMRVRTSVIAAVYKKSLKLSNAARRTSTVGEIVNLMSVDAQRFIELMTFLNMIWSGPFQMCVSLYFLWMTLGPSIMAGVAIMIILIPINAVIAKKNRALQGEQMVHKDNRIKLMSEVLNGIKVLKLYAWEPSFQKKVLNIRDQELSVMRKAAFLNAASSFTWTCAPFLVSLTTFAVYVLSSDENILDAQKAFVSLSLFNILRFPLAMLPATIANMVQASVSIKRLRTFFLHEELDPDNVDRVNTGKYSVRLENASFAWDKGEEKPTLQDLNIDIPEGQLVAVVGVVGAGKSSLMSAVLGEMEKLHGKVTVKGSVAYTAQQAWIRNATLRDNILFGRIHEDPEYSNVLEACALNPDLEILPGADLTEIGEKGINLSGGQKQRVSLARAVYQDTDVYLMDDPLSAVDSHVGKHIFEKVIGPKGLLRGKTRVLVTHGISSLPQMDQILVLVDGRVSERGSYRELLDHNGAFAEFLKTYLEEHEESEDESDDEEAALREEILSHIQVGSHKDESLLSKESKEKVARVRRDTSQSATDSPHVRNRKETLRSMSKNSDMGSKRSHCGSKTSLKKEHDRSKEKEALVNGISGKKDDKLIKEETSATGRVKLSVFLLYLRSMKTIVCIAIFSLYTLNNALQVGANFWLSDWSNDQLVNGTVDTDLRDLRLGVYGALGIAQGLALLGGALSVAVGGILAARKMHHAILYNILRSPMAFFDVTPSGRIVNRFASDMETLDISLPRSLQTWTYCLLRVLETMIVISSMTPIFLAVILPFAIFYFITQRFYVATSRQLKRLESVSRSPIYSHFGETIQGTSTIRAFRLQTRFIEDSDSNVDHNQECYYPSIVSNRWLAVRLELVGNLIVLFAALFAVIGRDHLSAGIVGLSISYALNVTQVLNWTVRMTSELENNIVSVERVQEYTVTPTEAAWEVPEHKPASDWPQNGEVEFMEYSTRYREGLDLVLKGISCQIRSGEKVGIVGRTGAGKSSLTMGLFRIIEAAGGHISIDGIKIADLGLHDVRSKITIIPQDPVLFSGSLRMNLDPFEYYNDDELWSALEHAHLKTFVLSLAEGLQHECSEGGENLSLGQRQLVCLARALLRKTKILVLDEATAAVDLETDDLIQNTIRTEFRSCTVMTIAHRLNTIMDYDRVMVFEAGKITEINTPQELLADKSSTFYSMARDAGLAE